MKIKKKVEKKNKEKWNINSNLTNYLYILF